ncbi:MAG: glycoside hydrolase family 32 protein [Ferruginibacter sp.]|nr:glycoside hydrolase family 32 protein [Chitinophagaceae bacterium]
MKYFFVLFFSYYTIAAEAQKNTFYKEKYRPQFHFTPAIHWMNDPNGLVYFKGEYHLFYQFNPFGNRWGHMSWGHAVSKDLLHWQHLPLAIPEEKDTMIFSGTCVVDSFNSTGFAIKPNQIPLVAIYTAHIENVSQSQHLAYSLDDGRTWTKYNKNPVLDIGSKEFRDPQVFWYRPQKKWVMSVVMAQDKKVRFYSSPDLKQWTLTSEFGPAGDVTGIWECPDLFEVPVEDEPGKSKWVLMLSPSPYMQYFVGEFNGTSFKSESPGNKIFRPDYGPDYYAAITYKNLPAHTAPISIGWVNNWNYANDIPTTPWKSTMALPRTIHVKKINDEWILFQKPVERIITEKKMIYKNFKVAFKNVVRLPVKSQQCEIEAIIGISNGSVGGLRIAAGNEHYLEFGYDSKRQVLYLDRSKTANQDFNKNFEKMNRYEVPYSLNGTKLKLRVFFDKSIVEIFINDGERVFTAQIFPDEKDHGIEFFNSNGYSGLEYVYVYELNSVW